MEFSRTFAARRADFRIRFIDPLRRELRTGLQAWIEDEADRLAPLGLAGQAVHFGAEYLAALSANVRSIAGPVARMQGLVAHWTAGIHIHDEQADVTLLMLNSNEAQRALLAHELAHAVIGRDPVLATRQNSRVLTQDPGIERLADDLARALILPRVLLHKWALPPGLCWRDDEGANVLQYLSQAAVPRRLGLTRILCYTIDAPCVLICFGARHPRSQDLFKPLVLEDKVFPLWAVDISPLHSSTGHIEYVFADRLRLPSGTERTRPKGDFVPGAAVDSAFLDQLLAGPTRQRIGRIRGGVVLGRDFREEDERIYIIIFKATRETPR